MIKNLKTYFVVTSDYKVIKGKGVTVIVKEQYYSPSPKHFFLPDGVKDTYQVVDEFFSTKKEALLECKRKINNSIAWNESQLKYYTDKIKEMKALAEMNMKME